MPSPSFRLVSFRGRPVALWFACASLTSTLLHCGGDNNEKRSPLVAAGGSAGMAALPAGGTAGSGPVPLAQTGAVLAAACPVTACGGDLKGTWELALDCVSSEASPDFQQEQQGSATIVAACPAALAEMRFNITGTAVFEAAGTYRITTTPLIYSTLIRAPKSCIKNAATTCQSIPGFVEKGDVCERSTSQTQDAQDEAGTYAVRGNDVKFTPAALEQPDTWTNLCVKGDVARAVSIDGNGLSYVIRLTRRGAP